MDLDEQLAEQPAAVLSAFGAAAVTMAGVTDLRLYWIECSHGRTQLHLHRRPSEDMAVLVQQLASHRFAILETEGQTCRCKPTEKQVLDIHAAMRRALD